MLTQELEKKISYIFSNKNILIEALTHKSAGKIYNYEKLEFLGDRVLGLTIAEKLNLVMFNKKLSDIHLKFESLTNETYLSQVANRIQLYNYIVTQSGEDGEKFKKNSSILSDVVEALIGAIYSDGSINDVKKFIGKFFNINNKKSYKNSKSVLQELVLNNGLHLPNYELVKKEGLDHAPFFKVKVTAMGFASEGKGKTIKIAEFNAAKNILKKIRERKNL